MAQKLIRCPHPDHEDKNPSCSHYNAGSEEERWYCFACKWRADRVQYEVDVNGLSMKEALAKHKPNTGKKAGSPKKSGKADAPKKEGARDSERIAQGFWDASHPLAGSDGERYLRSRGIQITYRNLRYHPAYPFPKSEGFENKGAIVARLEDRNGVFSGVQAVALDGTKASRGRLAGRGCYLGNPEPTTLMVAEGVIRRDDD